MKKIIYLTSGLIVLLIIMNCIPLYQTFYYESPDKSKVITFYRAFYQLNGNYYVIPYKYENYLPPKNNYCIEKTNIFQFMSIITMTERYINWYPSDTNYYLKANWKCIENTLNANIDINNIFDFKIQPKTRDDFWKEVVTPKYSLYYVENIFEEMNKNSVTDSSWWKKIRYGLLLILPILILYIILNFSRVCFSKFLKHKNKGDRLL